MAITHDCFSQARFLVPIPANFPDEDLNEAALRRTHSRVAELTVELS